MTWRQYLATCGQLLQLTFREHLRSRLLASAVLVATACVLLGLLGSGASIFARARLIVDLGLSAASVVGTVVAAAAALGTLTGEGHKNSEYLLLSRPVSRPQLLLGRYAGLAALLAALVAIVAGGSAVGCVLAGVPPPASLLPAAWACAVELWLSLALAFVFACACSAPLAATLFGAVFLAGQLADELRLLAAAHHGTSIGHQLAAAAFAALPDYARLSLRDFAAADLPVPLGHLADATCYGLGSAAAWLGVACLLYVRRARSR